MYAGGTRLTSDDDLTGRGGVEVCAIPLTSTDGTCSDVIWQASRTGRLKIVAVSWPHFILTNATGTLFGFNAETLEWEDPQPIPTVTFTPVPTNRPTSTSTAVATSTSTSTPTAVATTTPTATPVSGGSTRLKDITFESGNLTDATTGADSTFGTVSLETSAPIVGSYAARIPNAGDSYLREDFSAAADLYASFYVRFNALPSSSIQFVTLTDENGGTVGNIQLRNTGKLRLRVGATTIGVDSSTLQTGTVYRIGLRQKQGTGGNAILEAYLAEGSAPFGTPFASTTSGTWTTGVERFRVGPTAPTLMDFVVDDIRLDTGAMPTP